MDKTGDINKSCVNCGHSYTEDIFNDLMCDIDNDICIVDIDKDIFGTCEKFEEETD